MKNKSENPKKGKDPPGILDWLVDPIKGFFSGLFRGAVELSGAEVRGGSPQIGYYVRKSLPNDRVPWPASIIAEGLAGAFKYDEFGPDTLVEKAKIAVGGSSPEWKTEMEAGMAKFSTRIETEYLKKLIMPPQGASPITMDEARVWGTGLVSTSIGMATAIWLAHMITEAGSLGQIEGVNELYRNIMSATGLAAISAAFLRVPVDVGIITPTRQFYLNAFKPNIPPGPDLVTMVVREAFDPKMVVKAPPDFVKWMGYAGYSEEWCDRYWTSHFLPIGLRQAYENLWRGNWTKEQFMYALYVADIHPMWREAIYNVAFQPPGVRELGYGYDVGAYSVEDIEKYRRMAGQSPEDARKSAFAMVAYRTETERNDLRREALEDFVAGFDDETELRANLTALGGRPEIIDLWVARAKFRAKRDLLLDLKKTIVDQYVKGWIDEDQLNQDLIELGFVADRRAVLVQEALTRRLKYKREEETEKKKLMTLAKVEKARELGLLSDDQFITRVMDIGYTEEDARLMLQIELTPRPVSPEEMERRRRTILSRKNRAEHRYERTLARLNENVQITAGLLEDVSIAMKESLDIIDTQLAIIDEDLPTATPERAAVLTARRLVLVQRRELQVARYEARIRSLTEQQKNLTEWVSMITKQRDEELAEYDAELKLLEVAG